jgi:hypothetical protein
MRAPALATDRRGAGRAVDPLLEPWTLRRRGYPRGRRANIRMAGAVDGRVRDAPSASPAGHVIDCMSRGGPDRAAYARAVPPGSYDARSPSALGPSSAARSYRMVTVVPCGRVATLVSVRARIIANPRPGFLSDVGRRQ